MSVDCCPITIELSRTGPSSPWEKNPLHKPKRTGKDHQNRSGESDLPSSLLASRAKRGKRRCHDENHDHLTDFDTEVEREERPAERTSRKIHLFQDIGESEPMDEPKRKSNPRPNITTFLHQQIVEPDIDNAQGNGRL